MNISVSDIKSLREKTACSVVDCKKALEEASGDMEKAIKLLVKKGAEKLAKKKDRETKSGVIEAYSHNGRIGVVLELVCETDFVAKNETFKELAHDLVMQIAAMDPKDEKELEKQNFIKDEAKTIRELMDFAISKLGENIQVKRFIRFELGE
jgi:elongation factor Ts